MTSLELFEKQAILWDGNIYYTDQKTQEVTRSNWYVRSIKNAISKKLGVKMVPENGYGMPLNK